jgi:hypothetical protein
MVEKVQKPNVQLTANIPKAFKLAGCYWKVIETEGFYDQGMCYPEEHLIRVRKELPKQAKETTFYHELVHAILFTMGETNHDEKYVDTFGAFLHQFNESKVK